MQIWHEKKTSKLKWFKSEHLKKNNDGYGPSSKSFLFRHVNLFFLRSRLFQLG